MKTVIIIGGGYSVKEGIEQSLWDKIKDKEVWSLNFAYIFMPFTPKRQLWFDTTFFKQKVEDMKSLHEKGVELIARDGPIYDNFRNVIKTYDVVRVSKNWNVNSDKPFSGQMGLTGCMALSIAVIEKYDNIYLLGYDFGSTEISNTNTHFYQDKIKENKIQSSGVNNPAVYLDRLNIPKNNIKDFEVFLDYKEGKIYNVSLQSNLSYFPKISYEEFFRRIEINE